MHRLVPALAVALGLLSSPAPAAEVDILAVFAKALQDKRVGAARKTRLVDARPAVPGEIIVTIIAGEGVETRSKPASEGDMVVRNRCAETGNEQYLVAKDKFPPRYSEPLGPADAAGFRPYRPVGGEMLFFVLKAGEGPFDFKAPWGEAMVARPGDAIVRSPQDPKDTYRIARAAFGCTYEVTRAP